MKARSEYLIGAVSLLLLVGMVAISKYRSFRKQESISPKAIYLAGKKYILGDTLDTFQNIPVFYNGSPDNVLGISKSPNGYVYGLQYQCVEFIKRFYFDFLHHTFPIGSGEAVDFFETGLSDGQLNQARQLRQYTHPSHWKPEKYDILVFNATSDNKYGHVAIISTIWQDSLEIVQQNTGLQTRRVIRYSFVQNRWELQDKRVLGWLRKDSLPL